MKGWKKNLVFGLLTGLFALIFLEIVLQVAYLASPIVRSVLNPKSTMQMADPVLDFRPNPEFLEHDARGFRNATASAHARLVAIGDSFTYGYGVPPESAWPRRLEQMAGISTYNMSFGGYGAAHGYLLIEEALELKPDLIVFGMYSGNDLFDTFRLVYLKEALAEYRTKDASALAAINDLESEDSASDTEDAPRQFLKTLMREQPGARPGLQDRLRDMSRLYGLARAFRNILRRPSGPSEEPQWDRIAAAPRRPGEVAFESTSAQTLFTIDTRLIGLDFDDVRIAEGHRLTLDFLQRMNNAAREAGSDFAVVLFPTKEFVFLELVEESGLPDEMEAYQRLVANEAEMWRATKEFLTDHEIPYADTLPELRERVQTGDQPYPVDSDGHFNAKGNQAVAEFLKDYIDGAGFLEDAPTV